MCLIMSGYKMADFKQLQYQFAQAIRQPEKSLGHQGVKIEARRLAIYQSLFFNNIVEFVSNTFPVLKSLYVESDWHQLIRLFFSQYRSDSPIFTEIPKAFLAFLTDEYQLTETDPIFTRELAHYEWIELDVSIRQLNTDKASGLKDDTAFSKQSPSIAQIKNETFFLSPLASLVSYPYPVHQISQTFQPTEPSEQTYLVVYRNDQYEVNFLQINAATVFMLDLIDRKVANTHTQLLNRLIEAMPQVSQTALQQGLIDNLKQLKNLTILI